MDERCKRAVETAEMFVDRLATDEDREAASMAAWNVKSDGVLRQEPEKQTDPEDAEAKRMEALLWAAEAAAWTVTEEAVKAAESASLVVQGVAAIDVEVGHLTSSLAPAATEDQEYTARRADLRGTDEAERKAAYRYFLERAAACRKELQTSKNVAERQERWRQAELIRDSFHPFHRQGLNLELCEKSSVVALAQVIYDQRAFDRMLALADALEETGCHDADILAHCRGPGPHVRGCWVVDLLLGKG
jgi:hypothetical protein